MDKFLELMSNPLVDHNYGDNSIFEVACLHSRLDFIDIILEDDRFVLDRCNSIMFEMLDEHLLVLKRLFKNSRFDPCYEYEDHGLLSNACLCESRDIVEFLLEDKRIDPYADQKFPLSLACENGNLEIVKLLLGDSRINPMEAKGIITAYRRGHSDVVEEIINHPRFIPTNHFFQSICWDFV